MTRKPTLLTIMAMVFLTTLLVGCSSAQVEPTITQVESAPTQVEPTLTFTPLEPTLTPVEPTPTPSGPTPTPDPSIVWSDDFEDGDTEGWEPFCDEPLDYSVEDGVFTFGYGGSILIHPSRVTVGTWSFDVLLPEHGGTVFDLDFIVDADKNLCPWESWNSALWMNIENQPYTYIRLYALKGEKMDDYKDYRLDSKLIKEKERISGWHHIDITRNENGNVKIYLNQDLMLDYTDDFPYQSNYIFVFSCCEGPGLDNFVVRNQVIDIQPTE